jgi:hypothetical protein
MYINQNFDNNQVFSARKAPRYIYHFTTKFNYEQIKQQGYINLSKDYLSEKDAVFFLDWQNFIKRWGGILTGKNSPFLSKKTFLNYLLKRKGKRKMSLLRVPVDKLNRDDLYVRSQDILFDMCTNYQNEFRSRDAVLKQKFPHLFDFDSVNNAKKYKSKKHSVEYIYTKNIPLDIVKEVGCAELNLQTCNNKHNLLKFLNNLLSNTPEHKSLQVYKQ